MSKKSARIGNYRQDIDTEGVDPSMKDTMGLRKQPKATTPPPKVPTGLSKSQQKDWNARQEKIDDRKDKNAALRGAKILKRRTGK